MAFEPWAFNIPWRYFDAKAKNRPMALSPTEDKAVVKIETEMYQYGPFLIKELLSERFLVHASISPAYSIGKSPVLCSLLGVFLLINLFCI